jgi:hypothetical protein
MSGRFGFSLKAALLALVATLSVGGCVVTSLDYGAGHPYGRPRPYSYFGPPGYGPPGYGPPGFYRYADRPPRYFRGQALYCRPSYHGPDRCYHR